MKKENWFTKEMKKAKVPFSSRSLDAFAKRTEIKGPIIKEFDRTEMLREMNLLQERPDEKRLKEFSDEAQKHTPFGEKVNQVKFSDILGWGSGSRVQESYFLTLNVYFNLTTPKKLWDPKSKVGNLLALTPRVKNKSVNILCKYADLEAYLNDIFKYESVNSPSRNIYLGIFSLVRRAQLRGFLHRTGGPRPQTRSQTKRQAKHGPELAPIKFSNKRSRVQSPTESMDIDPAISNKVAEMFDRLNLSGKYPRFGSNIHEHVKERSDETETSTGASAIFQDLEIKSPRPSMSLNLPTPEDPVNATFVDLLQAFCMAIPTPLEWSSSKPPFTMTQGKARITAVADEQLSQLLDSDDFSYAILEVKPYLLRSHYFGDIIRQVGLEMVTWIYHCNDECKGCHQLFKDCEKSHKDCNKIPAKVARKPLSRYFIPCQFGVEAWIFVAECSPDYLKFLKSGRSEKPRARLPIHLCGPFSIYDFKDMFTFGLLIYALTLQITEDEFPNYDSTQPADITFTSGSGGCSKGVFPEYRDVSKAIQKLGRQLGPSYESRIFHYPYFISNPSILEMLAS